MKNKIKKEEDILNIVEDLRKKKKQFSTISGSFDLLHFGHIKSLKEASEQGDCLIVLLNSDFSVKRYKGPNRPIKGEQERAEILSAFEFVDYIFIFDDITPKSILKKIKPDVFCQSKEWGKDCLERKVVEAYGGKIYLLKSKVDTSTTDIIQKVLSSQSKTSNKAVFLDRDGTINEDKGYVGRIEDFNFLPGVVKSLKKISDSEYKLIIITNQSGIGRGYFSDKDVKNLHSWLIKKLEEKEINVDGIYYCPHKSDEGCNCRKPKIRLLEKAVQDLDIDLRKSWFMGNEKSDIETGKNANTKTILLSDNKDYSKDLNSRHLVLPNLEKSVNLILSN